MQSFFDRRGPRLDTSLPSVRHVQDLIRNRSTVQVVMSGGRELQGTVRWQDTEFIALLQDVSMPLILINRDAIVMLRALG